MTLWKPCSEVFSILLHRIAMCEKSVVHMGNSCLKKKLTDSFQMPDQETHNDPIAPNENFWQDANSFLQKEGHVSRGHLISHPELHAVLRCEAPLEASPALPSGGRHSSVQHSQAANRNPRATSSPRPLLNWTIDMKATQPEIKQ